MMDRCKQLIEQGGDLNQVDGNGETLLYEASYHGYWKICKLLLVHGANVDQANQKGETPLYIASLRQHKKTCKILLDHRADVNKAKYNSKRNPDPVFPELIRWDCEGSPLNAACYSGTGVCELLLKHGANVNQANQNGDSPLHLASGRGMDDICALLIKHGANVNQTNKYGKTPLHLASGDDICALLIKHGANVNQSNKDGKTPLQIATQHGAEMNRGLLHNALLQQALEDEERRHKTNIKRLKRTFAYDSMDWKRSVRRRFL